jgi:hypothetical protein
VYGALPPASEGKRSCARPLLVYLGRQLPPAAQPGMDEEQLPSGRPGIFDPGCRFVLGVGAFAAMCGCFPVTRAPLCYLRVTRGLQEQTMGLCLHGGLPRQCLNWRHAQLPCRLACVPVSGDVLCGSIAFCQVIKHWPGLCCLLLLAACTAACKLIHVLCQPTMPVTGSLISQSSCTLIGHEAPSASSWPWRLEHLQRGLRS